MKNFGCEYLRQLCLYGVSHFVSLLPNGLGVWKDAGTSPWQLVHSVDIKAIRDRLGDGGAIYIRDFAVASAHCCGPYDAMMAVAIETKVYILILHEGRWDLLHVATTDKIINKVSWTECALPTLIAYPTRGSPILIQLTKRRTKIEYVELFDSSLASRYGSVGCIPTAADSALFCSNSGSISLDDNNTDPAMLFLHGLNAMTTHNTPVTSRSDNLTFSTSLNALNNTFTNNGHIRGVCADIASACICVAVELNPINETLLTHDEFTLKLPNQVDQPRVTAGIRDLSATNSSVISEELVKCGAAITVKAGSFRHSLPSSTLMETLRPDIDAAAVPMLRLNIADKKKAPINAAPLQDSHLLLYQIHQFNDPDLYKIKYSMRIALRNLPARPDILLMKRLHESSSEGLIAVASSIHSVVNVLRVNYVSCQVDHCLYVDLLDYSDSDSDSSGKQSRVMCKGLQFNDDCTMIYVYGSWKASSKSALASASTGTVSSGAIYAFRIIHNEGTPSVSLTASMQPEKSGDTSVAVADNLLHLVLNKLDAMDSRLSERLQRMEQRLDEMHQDVAEMRQQLRVNGVLR